jgi:hypothetical protein
MSWKEGGMRRTLGLLAGSLLLAGCTTTVLEVRRDTPAKPLWGDRTLVVAAVDEWLRAGSEDAIVQRLPGSVAAHTLPDSPDAEDVRSSLLAGREDDAADDWDTLILLSIEDGLRYSLDGDVFNDEDGYVRVDVRISVFRTGDRREIYETTIRSASVVGGSAYERLAAYAADRAGKELVKTRLFDAASAAKASRAD